MQYVTILGSTGSIGQATLSVIQEHVDKFAAFSLVAKNNVTIMTEQCLAIRPKYACMIDRESAKQLQYNLQDAGQYDVRVLSGMTHACELASDNDVDMVMAAIVGIAGLRPIFSAVKSGKKVLLANKEALVTGGKLFMETAHRFRSCILPVDSEHNAIFQNLPLVLQKNLGRICFSSHGISHITLTASGGVFFKMTPMQLSTVTPEQACVHPNWSMGKKISIDSATMMNKGLEYIEARHLFNAGSNEIEILLHPQSIVHAMVHYVDGSVLTHLAPPDMRVAIAYAMAFPNRITLKSILSKLDISSLNNLHFEQLDSHRYPCLQLAIDASEAGSAATIILNSANEVAVESFLNRIIAFTDIPDLIHRVIDTMYVSEPVDIDDVFCIDHQAREKAYRYVSLY